MQRFFAVLACLAFALSLNAYASDNSLPSAITFTSAEELQAAGLASPLLAMNMKEIICENDVVLKKVEAESATFKCCSQDDRFQAAAETVKDVVYKISNICEEEGYDLSAIARICVTYKQVSREKCIAVVTAWYRCGCCVLRLPDVDNCKFDDTFCSEHRAQKLSATDTYECCNIDSRWNAIYDTMKSAYSEAAFKCSLLDCLGDIIVRGFQVDFRPVTRDGKCEAESTVFYSCCCVCGN